LVRAGLTIRRPRRQGRDPNRPACGTLRVEQYQNGQKRLEIFADGTTSPSPPCSHGPLRSAVTQLFRRGLGFFPGVGKLWSLGDGSPQRGPEREPLVGRGLSGTTGTMVNAVLPLVMVKFILCMAQNGGICRHSAL